MCLRWETPACTKEKLSTSAHTSRSPTDKLLLNNGILLRYNMLPQVLLDGLLYYSCFVLLEQLT